MQFNVLGMVEVEANGLAYRPKAEKLCKVLGLLVFRANRFVATDTIMQELWGDHRPASSLTTTQTYIYHLRRAFSRELEVERPEEVLTTQPGGYLLRVERGATDCMRFEELVEDGRDHLDRGRWAEAARTLGEALELWRSPRPCDGEGGHLHDTHLRRYEELWRTAVEMRVTADMQRGRSRELIPLLRDLVAEHPFNEWFHARLMTCLHVAGRRHEALEAYQSARRILVSELGLEPSAELQQMQRTMLAAS